MGWELGAGAREAGEGRQLYRHEDSRRYRAGWYESSD